jgi:hypothetical protein
VDLNAIAEGPHEFSLVARDFLGNQVGTFSESLTNIESKLNKTIRIRSASNVDLPTVELIYPNSIVTSSSELYPTYNRGDIVNVVISGKPSSTAEVSAIQLLSNGVPVGFQALEGIQYTLQHDPNNTHHQLGIYQFSFEANSTGLKNLRPIIIDNFGNHRLSEKDTIINVKLPVESAINGTSPYISWVYPEDVFSMTKNSRMNFLASVNHADGSLLGVQFYVNGIEHGDFLYYEKDKPRNNDYYTIELEPPYTQDVNIITASALDTSGNVNFAPALVVTLRAADSKIPQVTMDPINASYSDNQSIFLSATVSDSADSSSGRGVVEEVSFVINGQVEQSFMKPPYFWIWDANESGLYTVFVSARDNEGNVAVSESYTTQIGQLNSEQKPLLGSTTPSILGQVKIYDGVQQVVVSGSQRRIAQTNQVEKTTVIQGLSTQFLSQLSEGQIVRFANGPQLSSKNYIVLEITDDETLKLQGEMNPADLALLSGWSELQFFNVYRIGSLIPLNLNSNVNDDSYVAVEFYENGTLIERDTTWPFSSSFVPSIEGNYSIAVVAESVTGEESLYTERIEVLPKLGFLPDGSTSLLPDLTRPGSTTIGSELIFLAQYDDIDSGMNRVEFYLNGDLIHIDREKPFYCKFKPLSDSDIIFTDRTWELTAVGIDNDQNRVAFSEVGSVQSSVLLPTANIKVPLNDTEYAHEQSIQIRVDVRGNNLETLLGRSANVPNPNIDLTPRQMNILGNGEFICVAQESAWGSGIFLADWVCDQNLAGESGKIEIVGSIVMEDSLVGGLNFTPSVLSDIVTIKVVEPDLTGDPKAIVNQTFKDLLGKSASEQEVNAAITAQMESSSTYLFENDDFLRWAAHLSEREIFQNMVDAIAGYKIMIGSYPDYLKISEIMDTYSAIPNYGQDGSIDEDGDGFSLRQENLFLTSDQDATDFPSSAFSLGSFVDDTLSSSDFTDIYGEVPALTPPTSGADRFTNYEKNRRDFVRIVYRNKYGVNPTIQQETQGSYRISVFDPSSKEAQQDQRLMMMQQMAMYSNFGFGGGVQGGGQGGGNINPFASLLGNTNLQNTQQESLTFRNGEPAVLFVVNMIAEETINNMDMIWGAQNRRDYYNTAALIASFWQDNMGVLSDKLILQFHGKSTESKISELMKDQRYSSRFGGLSISRIASDVESAPGWKWLHWLGHFNDVKFPWIYHSGLGWIYVHGPTDEQTWFYLQNVGWLGTTKHIWSEMTESSEYLWLYDQKNARWIAYYLQQPEGDLFWDPQTQSYFKFD